MKRFLRTLLRIHAVVERAEAVQIAKRYAIEKGWPWVEPIHVNEGLTEIIRTNASNRGGNANIYVAITTGAVVSAGSAPR